MNIAIITQPLGMNIGGILQNWALQKTLIAMGHNPVTINYRPVDAISLKDRLRIPARNVRTLLRRLNKRHDRFMKLGDTLPNRHNLDFIADEINTTDRCDKYSVIDGCDAYITGSDQVWRPRYNKGILADKFLEFTENTDCRRIAYAASFGTYEWEFNNEQTQKCRQLLKKFHKVSVREDSGITLCRRYLDHDAELVADPTLLVGATDYLSLCGKIENCGHTASYLLDIDSRKLGIARKTAILTQSELIDLHPQRTSVRQWISSIAGAGKVITDSFHGTVFAIVFHRDFAVIPNLTRGNSRLMSLLNLTGLSDRIVKSDNDIERILAADIDWNDVDRRLSEFRDVSLDFLNNALR